MNAQWDKALPDDFRLYYEDEACDRIKVVDQSDMDAAFYHNKDRKLKLYVLSDEVSINLGVSMSYRVDCKEKETQTSSLATTTAIEQQHVHKQIQCSVCKVEEIVGTRYHCAVMKIDVCQSCEPTFEHQYPFLKFKKPIENYDPVTVVPQPKQMSAEEKLMNYYKKVFD